jgi:hypothetical protein
MAQDFNFEIPYHIFVGLWFGKSLAYTPKGDFVSAWTSTVALYWEEPYRRLHYRQDPVDADALAQQLRLSSAVIRLLAQEFDFHIQGKYATSISANVKNLGAETTTDSYIFHIIEAKQSWYNNQYFPSPNERRVIGPQMDDNGNVTFLISQQFTLVSSDVPPHYRRALRLE